MNTLNEAITNHPLFHGMRREHLVVLTETAKAAEFKAGEVLFREGEPAHSLYLIESGRVALEAHGTVPVESLGPREVLGWSWLFPPFVWHSQARALEPTKLIVLSGAHLLSTAESNHDFGFELMKRVAHVVIHRLQTTRQQLLGLQK